MSQHTNHSSFPKVAGMIAGLGLLTPLSAYAQIQPVDEAKVAIQNPSETGNIDPAIERGHYVAVASDCMACHTAPGSKTPFSGGYALTSPVGSIYSSNITPSKQFGIGNYTLKDFSNAVRHGIRKDGANLYPAMPFDSYAGMSDQDITDLYAYFMKGVKPVDIQPKQTNLIFPFSVRLGIYGWKIMDSIFAPATYKPDPSQSADWNRGKYLTDTLEHCGTCHTTRNFFLIPEASHYLAGSNIGLWHAPDITPNKETGLGSWSDQDIASYLKTGMSAHSRAGGPMGEAVEHSLQYLKDEDINAIITYLRSVRPATAKEVNDSLVLFPVTEHKDTEMNDAPSAMAFKYNHNNSFAANSEDEMLYQGACASCHQANGQGTEDQFYPALVDDAVVDQPSAQNLVATILEGMDRNAAGVHQLMPNFSAHSLVQPLTDQQIVQLGNYVINRFGHGQTYITLNQVHELSLFKRSQLMIRAYSTYIFFGVALTTIAFIALFIRWKIKRQS